jgi:hypothetical protein
VEIKTTDESVSREIAALLSSERAALHDSRAPDEMGEAGATRPAVEASRVFADAPARRDMSEDC